METKKEQLIDQKIQSEQIVDSTGFAEVIRPGFTKSTLIISGLLFLFIVGILSYFLFVNNEKISKPILDKKIPILLPTITNTQIASKYDQDTDGDCIPDIVETAIAYDPNKDECPRSPACGLSLNPIASTSAENLLFVLDVSGSMAETIGGESKMTIAKSALTEYLKTISSNVNVGLMVYGHKGSNSNQDKALSCNSIDLLYPLASIDNEKIINLIQPLTPTGWTAVGGSLKKAATVFEGRAGQRNRVLIITDGIETCDTDPIQAARDLQSLGIKPIVDVIGFNLDANSKRQLEQVAEVGNGKYFDARSRQELTSVFWDWQKNKSSIDKNFLCETRETTDYVACAFNQRYAKASQYLGSLEVSVIYKGKPFMGVTADVSDKLEEVKRARDKVKKCGDEIYDTYLKQSNKSIDDRNTNINLIGTQPPTR